MVGGIRCREVAGIDGRRDTLSGSCGDRWSAEYVVGKDDVMICRVTVGEWQTGNESKGKDVCL